MMKENLLDVLVYLFENYMTASQTHSPQGIAAEMIAAGFTRQKVHEAFDWFEVIQNSLADLKQTSPVTSVRIYSTEEILKTTRKARGYLLHLEQAGIINAINRELIIDRAMALKEPIIGLPEIQWVTLMVLFNQPDMKNQLNWMEEFLFGDIKEALH